MMDAGGGASRRDLVLILLPALLAPLAVQLALALPGRWLLPSLATAAVYPVFATFVLRGRRGAAFAAGVLWAAALSASLILATARDPARTGAAVIHGPAYKDEMFAYVASGHGRESEPGRFLPQHALHLAAFAALSLLSGGLLGIVMGAILVGYMSYYVGSLAAGPAPHLAFALGWPPWAVLRVLGFILIGVVLARPLLARLARRPIPAHGERRILLLAAVLLILDVTLKASLATTWATLLRPCLPGSP